MSGQLKKSLFKEVNAPLVKHRCVSLLQMWAEFDGYTHLWDENRLIMHPERTMGASSN